MRWMRSGLFVLAAVTAAAASTSSAGAEEYPWCAVYSDHDLGATNCGFVSYAQCLATISGIGGSCRPNLRYPDVRVRTHRSRH